LIDRRIGTSWIWLAILVPLTVSEAARLPDWAKRIADTAPEYGDTVPEHPSRVLLSEISLIVQQDGKLRVRRRTATQALSWIAADVGLGVFHFDEDTEILRSRGWHLPAEGKAKKSSGAAMDLSLDDAFLSDQKVRFIGLDGVEKGSLVFFEFEAIEEPEQLAHLELFHEGAPIEVARLTLQTPPDWSVRYAWLRNLGPEPSVREGVRIWELRHLEMTEPEELGQSPVDRAPILLLSFSPPPGIEVGPASIPDWISLAHWYEELAAGREAVTPEIAETARQVLDLSDAGFLPGVRSTGVYVRDQVRYVAKEIGIGGYRPHAAGQVLHQLYGDCKDKGTLFRSMLAAEGRESYPILINTSLSDTVSEEVPYLGSFNHFVVGVPVPEEIPVPAAFRPAMIEAGELGPLLVVDTTDEYTSVGYLPEGLAGKTGFVIAGDESTLVDLPAIDTEANRIEKELEAEIRPDSSVTLRLETVRYGVPAAATRYAYRQSVREYRERAERTLLQRWPQGTVKDFAVVDETEDGGFIETVKMEIGAPPDPETAELFQLFPGALADLPRVPLGRRETAVKYGHAITLRFETTIRGFASRSATPGGDDKEGDGWSTGSSFERDGDALQGKWEMTLSRLRFEPDEFRELKRMWSSARRSSSAAISLAP